MLFIFCSLACSFIIYSSFGSKRRWARFKDARFELVQRGKRRFSPVRAQSEARQRFKVNQSHSRRSYGVLRSCPVLRICSKSCQSSRFCFSLRARLSSWDDTPSLSTFEGSYQAVDYISQSPLVRIRSPFSITSWFYFIISENWWWFAETELPHQTITK